VRVARQRRLLRRTPRGTPIRCCNHVKANRSLHRTVLLFCRVTRRCPSSIPASSWCARLGEGSCARLGRYGNMQSHLSELMERIREHHGAQPQSTVFFFNRR